ETRQLSVRDGGRVTASTFATGDAGNININASDSVLLTGEGSGLFANTDFNSTGEGGKIDVSTKNINLTNGGQISVQSLGTGKAGDITINANGGKYSANNGQILAAAQTGGGNINVSARNILLRNNSDIKTNSIAGNGGNIFLTADSIIALEDSDILAFAPFGRGGNIQFTSSAFLSDPLYRPSASTTNAATLEALDGNNRVDVNASGTVSGTITGVPDVSFLQNSLTELPQNAIDTNALIANSCIARSPRQEGTFTITGSGGLPYRPGDASISPYPTGTVRRVTPSTLTLWQKGDPIVEPTGVYRLENGRLVMSRECLK
ncbi:S-layer family protein, partial [Pleurocapsales cyanobacterium LEGE 06147]|nr:S-layer family protein [Pleurocapsales cyanobacterium LEGE 06147]